MLKNILKYLVHIYIYIYIFAQFLTFNTQTYMKKLLILIVSMFVSLSMNTWAEQIVGSFENTYFGKNFTIEAYQENNKLKKVYIEVLAKDSKSAFICVSGDDLELFNTSLELVRDKFLSWVKIAKDNNVTEMNKEFDIKFPSVSVSWYGSKWWFAFYQEPKMSFLILDDGRMLALWIPKVASSSNEYIDETIYFVFETEEDFNSLIKQLNPQGILNQLLNTQNKAELFQ